MKQIFNKQCCYYIFISVTQGEWAARSRARVPSADITGVSPGAFAANSDTDSVQKPQTAMLERMNLDVYSLKKQYWRIQKRQQSAHVIYGAAGTKEESRGNVMAGVIFPFKTHTLWKNQDNSLHA